MKKMAAKVWSKMNDVAKATFLSKDEPPGKKQKAVVQVLLSCAGASVHPWQELSEKDKLIAEIEELNRENLEIQVTAGHGMCLPGSL